MDSTRPGGATRRFILKHSRILPLTVVFLLFAVLTAVPAQAVHDETFQLDGDVSASTVTNLPTPSDTQLLDWDSLFDSAGATKALPEGFKAAKLTRDFLNSGTTFITSDTTTFATGSKDTLPISGWQCNFDNNVNSKIDVMNAYAAAYTDPSGDQLIYFGLERNTNTGDANVAFWFLQDDVSCETAGASETFAGEHKDGDLLIVSAFSKGGNVSTISVYRWERPGNPVGVPGFLNTTPVAAGVDCRSTTTAGGDLACAAANTTANGTGGTINTPWLTSNFKTGVGNQLLTGEFFEGGLNLTDSGLGGKCFNTFIGDTRSSTSLTSTLFDYAGGKLGECGSTTVTTPSISSQEIPADGTLDVTDSARVTVTGVPLFSGEVAFRLCGPFAANSTNLCDTGGVDAGTRTLTDVASPHTVTSDTMTVTEVGRYCWAADYSGDAERGVPGSSDSRESECFTVTPRQSVLRTQAGTTPVDFGQPVTDTATLQNTANRQGSGGPAGSTDGSINPATAGGPAGGTITFKLYGPDSCTMLAAEFPVDGIEVDVSGDRPRTGQPDSYGPVSFTPQATGVYHWKASYSGDLPNTLATSHNADCSDTNERVVVRTIPTTTVTTPSDSSGVAIPNPLTTGVALGTNLYDLAVVTANEAGGGNVPGNVNFWVCDPSQVSGEAGSEVCGSSVGTALTGNPRALVPDVVTPPANPSSRVLSSPAVVADKAGLWCFRATYVPTGTTYTGSSDNSHTECVKVNPDTTTTVTTPKAGGVTITGPVALNSSVTDYALVTGTTAGGTPTGTVSFWVCDPDEVTVTPGEPNTEVCTTGGTLVTPDPVTLLAKAGSTPPAAEGTSGAVTVDKLGVWCFRAEFTPSGANAANYTGSSDASHSECFTVRTTSSATSAQNWLPNDSVTVSSVGDVALSGTLDITLREDSCTGTTVAYTEPTINLSNTASGTSFLTTNTTVKVSTASNKDYYWRAVFTSSNPFVDGITKCEMTNITINNNP